VILGVNSTELATLAGARCDGINVRAEHPQLEAILAAADAARAGAHPRDWEASVWAFWDASLLDPAHPRRVRWEALGVSRLVMVFLEPYDAAALRAAAPRLREP
jgi:hypothetical protein